MDVSPQPKRNEPETRVEPRGKAGRPKMFKYGTDRTDGTKRDGGEIPEETNKKRAREQTRIRKRYKKG